MSISDDLSDILDAIAPESVMNFNLRDGLLDLGAEDVHATGVTVADAAYIPQPSFSSYIEDEVAPGAGMPAGPFDHIGSYDLATDGGTLDLQAIGLEDAEGNSIPLSIHGAKFVLGAENAPSSSTIDVVMMQTLLLLVWMRVLCPLLVRFTPTMQQLSRLDDLSRPAM